MDQENDTKLIILVVEGVHETREALKAVEGGQLTRRRSQR